MTIKDRFINSLFDFSPSPTLDQYVFSIIGSLVLNGIVFGGIYLSGKIAENIKK